MTTGGGAPNGLIRFNVDDLSATRFGSQNYIQVAAGRNGLLYGEYPGGSPGGGKLDVFDPSTLSLLRTIVLEKSDMRSVAVSSSGDIFAVNFSDPNIYKFDPNGLLLGSLNTQTSGLYEINLDSHGRLLATAFGSIVFSDISLSSYTTQSISNSDRLFAAFVEPPLAGPEPSAFLLCLADIPGLGFHCRRSSRRIRDAIVTMKV